MEPETETGLVSLDGLGLTHGDAATLQQTVELDRITLGGQAYTPDPAAPEVRVDVSRTTSGYALRLRFQVNINGPCFRCLEPASVPVPVDVREVDQPEDALGAEVPGPRAADTAPDETVEDGDASGLLSPYVEAGQLDLQGWVRDALILAMPNQILCREDCLGLCAVCGETLNGADPADHDHGQNLDPRWSKLRDLG